MIPTKVPDHLKRPSEIDAQKNVVERKKLIESEMRQRTSDLEHLATQPQFRRYLTRWADELRFFKGATCPQASEMYARDAKRHSAEMMLFEVWEINRDAYLEIVESLTTLRVEAVKHEQTARPKG